MPSALGALQIEKAERERQAKQGQPNHPRSPKKGKEGFLDRMKLDLEDRKHRLKVQSSSRAQSMEALSPYMSDFIICIRLVLIISFCYSLQSCISFVIIFSASLEGI